MAAEKLTILPPVSIRFTESQLRDLQMLADMRGMERSDYIRHLVTQDKLVQHKLWLALDPLFAGAGTEATNTANNKVIRRMSSQCAEVCAETPGSDACKACQA